ncbi:hotdog domain-containing protein [Rhodococcus sp. NPDC057297]|uniref:hotdog domain-containing protein n=1 Tax=Rhodococcus sp. NPDC057297 TaxID=3346090 RepID=UPI003626F051
MDHSAQPFVAAGAEQLLGIEPVDFSAEHGQLTMATGPWLLDPVAGVTRSPLGVALDDVTGYVVARGAPAGLWPVSLGIRLDFLADPPVDGSPLVVTGDLVHRNANSGTTRGCVTDAGGTPVALVTQRSHLVPFDGPFNTHAVSDEFFRGTMTLRDRLRMAHPESTDVLVMSPTPFSANGMGNVHGGVLILGSELAAHDVVDSGGTFRTTSIDIAFVRPGDGSAETPFHAEVVHRGRTVAVVRVTARNAAGKPCSIATVTLQAVATE